MGQVASDGWVGFPAAAGSRRRRGALTGLGRIAAALATTAAVAVAAVLTLVFAATLAVVVVLSALLVSLYALTRRRRAEGVLIEARRVGHSWVAYGWDQRTR